VSKRNAKIGAGENDGSSKTLRDTKFISLLSTLSSEEMAEFSKFIDSPYLNRKGPYIKRAFSEIRQFHPDYDSPLFTKARIFSALYPERSYNDVLLRKILSELQKLGEDFLGLREIGDFDFSTELKKLSSFRKRKLNKLFEKKYSDVSGYLADPTGKVNKDYFRNLYDLEIEAVNFELINDKQENTFESLKNIEQHITYDFLINILDIQYNLLVGGDTNFKREFGFITELIKQIDFAKLKKFLKNDKTDRYIIFEIFYYRWLSFLEVENDMHYFKLKELVVKHLDYFNREEKNTMLIALQNNAIHRTRAGKYEFHNEVFSVYKIMLDKNLLIASDEENMQLSTFRNIFLTARTVGEHAWSEWFVDNYIGRLDPDKRENTYHHSRALIEFDNKRFDEATKELQKVRYDHFMHKLDAQLLLLKIYYETGAYEPALSLIDSLNHYYKDSKMVSEVYRNNNGPFLKFVQKLILVRLSYKKKDAEELIYSIQNTKVLDKKWLIQKAGDLDPK